MAQVGIGDQYILPLGAMHAAKPGDKVIILVKPAAMAGGSLIVLVPLSNVDFAVPFAEGAVTAGMDPLQCAYAPSGSNTNITITGTSGTTTKAGLIVIGTVAFN